MMATVAGPGRWNEIEIRIGIEAAVAGVDPGDIAHLRKFYIRCGGCPWGQEITVPVVMLEDIPMPKLMTTQGWQVDPLRCPYCTGRDKRPDDTAAAPYPITEGG